MKDGCLTANTTGINKTASDQTELNREKNYDQNAFISVTKELTHKSYLVSSDWIKSAWLTAIISQWKIAIPMRENKKVIALNKTHKLPFYVAPQTFVCVFGGTESEPWIEAGWFSV